MVVVSSCRDDVGLRLPQRAQPLPSVDQHSVGDSGGTAGDKPEEGGETSNHHAPYGLGYTRTTMAVTTCSDLAIGSESLKDSLSSD